MVVVSIFIHFTLTFCQLSVTSSCVLFSWFITSQVVLSQISYFIPKDDNHGVNLASKSIGVEIFPS